MAGRNQKYIMIRWLNGKRLIFKVLDDHSKEVIAECTDAKKGLLVVRALRHYNDLMGEKDD